LARCASRRPSPSQAEEACRPCRPGLLCFPAAPGPPLRHQRRARDSPARSAGNGGMVHGAGHVKCVCLLTQGGVGERPCNAAPGRSFGRLAGTLARAPRPFCLRRHSQCGGGLCHPAGKSKHTLLLPQSEFYKSFSVRDPLSLWGASRRLARQPTPCADVERRWKPPGLRLRWTFSASRASMQMLPR
jgi:hypothetical protein